MAIKIPNTLEPANNDFPVVSSNHIDVDELEGRKNLTQYLKDVYAELTDTLEANHSDDDDDRQKKYDDLVSYLNTLLGNSDDGDKSIEDQLTDLKKLLLLSLFGNETYEPSNEDNADGSGRNITNKIRDLRNSIVGWLYNNSDSIYNNIRNLSSDLTKHDKNLNSKSSSIIEKIETERANIVDNTNDNTVALSNQISEFLSDMHLSLDQLKYDVKNFNERIVIRSIDKHFNNGVSTADINIFCDLQDDETIFVKSASMNYFNKTISLSENILLDDGSNLEEGTVNNDLNIITLNNGENMILIKDIQLNASTPTDVTICILRQGQIAYKKNVEIMRKAPVYVKYSSEESISFNTTDQNYLVDSLHGELIIPAYKDESGIDKYLYIGIPKTYFSQKTIETGLGSTTINLQLLQNGFSVGSFLEETSDYYIYRSSQKISEHSNLELK